MKYLLKSAILITLLTFACGSGNVIPEMKTFINSFGDKAKMEEVIKKYAEPEIIPEALKTCNLEKPIIKKTEKKDGAVIYTAESRVAECEKSETAVGTIRVFKIGWTKGRITSFEWQGPKSGKVEY